MILRFALTLLLATTALACGEEIAGDGDGDGDADAGANDMFSVIYRSAPFTQCGGCHAPGAPGATIGIEATQDWSSRDSAFSALMGNASGLMGNFEGCNDVPLVGASPEASLIVAALDADIRSTFTATGFADCDGLAISDMSLKVGAIPAEGLDALKAWITAGAPNE